MPSCRHAMSYRSELATGDTQFLEILTQLAALMERKKETIAADCFAAISIMVERKGRWSGRREAPETTTASGARGGRAVAARRQAAGTAARGGERAAACRFGHGGGARPAQPQPRRARPSATDDDIAIAALAPRLAKALQREGFAATLAARQAPTAACTLLPAVLRASAAAERLPSPAACEAAALALLQLLPAATARPADTAAQRAFLADIGRLAAAVFHEHEVPGLWARLASEPGCRAQLLRLAERLGNTLGDELTLRPDSGGGGGGISAKDRAFEAALVAGLGASLAAADALSGAAAQLEPPAAAALLRQLAERAAQVPACPALVGALLAAGRLPRAAAAAAPRAAVADCAAGASAQLRRCCESAASAQLLQAPPTLARRAALAPLLRDACSVATVRAGDACSLRQRLATPVAALRQCGAW